MATDRKDLETRLIATDKASKVIEHVAGDLDKLERKGDVEVELTAKDKASDDIRTLDKRLAGLSDEDKTIVLRAQAKDAQRDIDRILRSLRDVDKVDDETVKIRIEALGDARTELKQIQEQADKLDKEKVDVTVDADTTGITGKFSQLKTDLAGATTGMDKFRVLSSTAFSNLSSFAVPALATAGVAIGAFVTKAVTDFQTLGVEVGKMRDTLGIPAEQASRLKEVADDIGVPIGTLTTAIGKMNRAAATSPDLFSGMNAAIVRSDDGATDVMATFLNVVDALNNIPDATQRAAAAQQVFGKGWSQISELIIGGSDEIVAAMRQVGDEKIVSDADIAKARDMRASMDKLRDSVEAVTLEAGDALLPVFESLAETAAQILGPVAKVTKAIGDAQKSTEERGKKRNFLEGLRDTALKTWPSIVSDAKHHADVIENAFGEATKGAFDRTAMDDYWDGAVRGAIAYGREQAGVADEQERAGKDQEARLGLAVSHLTAYATVQREVLDNQLEMAAAVVDMIKGVAAYDKAIKGVDWKNADIEGAISGMQDFRDAHFGLAEIAQNSADAETALGEAVKENGKNFDLGTEAGLKNLDAIKGLAEQVDVKLAAAYDNANGNQKKFNDSAKEIADTTLARLADQMNLSQDQTAELAGALGLMPADIETRYKLSGTEEAITKVGLLQTSIDDLPKDVETKVTQKIIAGDYKGALAIIQKYYDDNPATLPVIPTISRGPTSNPIFGGTTTTSGFGATAATRAVGVAPAMTLPAVTVPVAAPTGGVSRTQVVNQYMTFNAGVIGGGYDVMTTVDTAMRRAARLLPKDR